MIAYEHAAPTLPQDLPDFGAAWADWQKVSHGFNLRSPSIKDVFTESSATDDLVLEPDP